jgi:hypothetical protein
MSTAPLRQDDKSQALLGNIADQRLKRRRLLGLPAWIIVYTVNSRQKYVARVRDMTRAGMFFYSELRPSVGEEIDFILRLPRWTKAPALACKGEVLRVEQSVSTTRLGIALRLNRFTVCN